MHIEFLVEEPSVEEVLNCLAPKLLGDSSFTIHVFQGKQNLLNELPSRLKGYSRWMPDDYRIVVLVDEDRQECHDLKTQIENMAIFAGLATKSHPDQTGKFKVLIRIVVEELEAWFFGDIPALAAAFPGVPNTLGKKAKFRNPDGIFGGTWEALERVLQRAGYFSSGLAKAQAAHQIAVHMHLHHNRSHSFNVFCDGLVALLIR